MALFAKKKDGTDAQPAVQAAPAAAAKKKGLGFGRKKETAPATPAPDAAEGFEDFADFGEVNFGDGAATTDGAAATATGGTARPTKRKPLKNGMVVGLNIGNDSIKAVEMRAKGNELTITALGQTPTPPESISNGVVMSVGALATAIRDLLKQAGIKTKRVVTSVSGTGALAVRIIEVPRMSDSELADNMKVDADRYIPFPPSEVVMDFKALRELPSDPDSTNMEVLLAAAQREIIDLHIKVLEEARLDPRAIDVEPLSAARAVMSQVGEDGFINYNDVSALINMGATSSEISVLRGDILVFTRSVPLGGHYLTQALVNSLGLPWHDAERVKQTLGDALTPPQPGMAPEDDTQTGSAGWEDFGEDFGTDTWGDHTEEQTHSQEIADEPGTEEHGIEEQGEDTDAFGSAADLDNIFDSFDSPTAPPTPPAASPEMTFSSVSTSAAPPGAGTAAGTTTDPFDPAFFEQGPLHNEPPEQHGQQEDDTQKPPAAFDFASFSFSDEPKPDAAATPITAPAAAEPGTAAPAEATLAEAEAAAPMSFNFALTDEASGAASAMTPPAQAAPDIPDATAPTPAPELSDTFNFGAPDASAPTATAAPYSETDEEDTDESQELGRMSFDQIENLTAPPPPTPRAEAPAASAPATPLLGFTEEPSSEQVRPAVSPSAYDLSSFDLPDQPLMSGGAEDMAGVQAGTVTPAGPAAEADEFDIDSMFGAEDTAGATETGFETGAAADAAAGGLDFTASDFGLGDFGTDLSSFGAGLSDTEGMVPGVDAATVHNILLPLLEELANEIRRSLEYHASRYPDAMVRHITLVGGGAKLKNIDAYLTQALGIPTTVGNPALRLTLQAPNLEEGYAEDNGPAFAVAIGLAMRNFV